MKSVIALIALGVVGCSSYSPPPTAQMCDIKSEMVVKKDGQGNIVNQGTKETMICSDSNIERMAIKQSGVAKNCGEYTYYVTLNGKPIQQRGLACEKFNGNWEVIPNYSVR